MKICLINNIYKPYDRGGGSERITDIIVNGLKKAGHDVMVITTKPFFTRPKPTEEQIHYIQPTNSWKIETIKLCELFQDYWNDIEATVW